MSLQATIKDHVTSRPGDGAPIEIPPGPVEIDLSADSATLSWTEENGTPGLAAIPLTQYNDYVRNQQITLKK